MKDYVLTQPAEESRSIATLIVVIIIIIIIIIIIMMIFIEDTNFTRSDLQKGPLKDYSINYKMKIYINYIVYVKYILKLNLRATNYNNKKNYKTT